MQHRYVLYRRVVGALLVLVGFHMSNFAGASSEIMRRQHAPLGNKGEAEKTKYEYTCIHIYIYIHTYIYICVVCMLYVYMHAQTYRCV